MPVIDCTVGEFAASLGNEREADAEPLDWGVNVTVKVAD